MRVYNSAGKGTSGMDKFGSVIDRMSMKLGSKFLTLWESRPSSLKCSSVWLLWMVQRVTEGGAQAFVLFLRGAHLVLRSGSPYSTLFRWGECQVGECWDLWVGAVCQIEMGIIKHVQPLKTLMDGPNILTIPNLAPPDLSEKDKNRTQRKHVRVQS